MKKNYTLIFALFCSLFVNAQTPCVDGMAGTYPCDNVDLLAFVPLADIGNGANTNDIWGWVSPVTNKEYALIGCSNGTAFLNITDPVNPVYLGLLPTHTVTSLWRDLETYQNYCFIASEATGHGLQVFDLLQLDLVVNAPVSFTESAHYPGFGHCHTLTVNTQTGFCYCVGTDTFDGGLHIVDINDPLNPTLAGGFSADGYTHDCYSWLYDGPDVTYLGKELIFGCNEDQLSIIDVTDKSDCHLIGAYDYEGQAVVGYIHQGWVTKDKKHFLIDDELDELDLGNNGDPYGTRTHVFDIENIDNVNYIGYHESTNTSIDHNLYVKDQFVFESNYRSGLRILDAVKVSDGLLNEVAFFDLYPQNDFAQYSGTWSNYPYLPSGVNIATSMYSGFFILKPTMIELSENDWDLCGTNEVIFDVNVRTDLAFPLTFALSGLPGASVSGNTITGAGVTSVTISGLNSIASGDYYPDLLLQTNFNESYVVPLKMHLANGISGAPSLLNVQDGALVSNTAVSTLFEWASINEATTYEFQLASSSNFGDPIEVQTTDLTTYLMTFDLPDGTYFWRVRAINDCGVGSWSEVFDFTVLFVGVQEQHTGRKLNIYPNPANDNVIITSSLQLEEISITDLSGRLIFKQKVQNGLFQTTLNVSELPSGIYFLKSDNTTIRFTKE